MDKTTGLREELPPEYFRAAHKYLFLPQGSAKDFAFRRKSWQKMEEVATTQPKEEANRIRAHVAADIRIFSGQATKAYKAGDVRFFQKLVRSLQFSAPVEIRFCRVVAVLRAFEDIYEELHYSLPTQEEVIERADRYLKERAWPPTSRKQWLRILRTAGLQSLVSVRFGRIRKAKRTSRKHPEPKRR